MTDERKAALQDAGFAVGDAAEFLRLSPAERAVVDARMRRLQRFRAKLRRLTVEEQLRLAAIIRNRVADMVDAETRADESQPNWLTRLLRRFL
jgi:N-glycosylase/DNA lyase